MKKFALFIGAFTIGFSWGIAVTWYVVHGDFPLHIILTGLIGSMASVVQGCR